MGTKIKQQQTSWVRNKFISIRFLYYMTFFLHSSMFDDLNQTHKHRMAGKDLTERHFF